MRLLQVGLGLWGLNWATEVLPQMLGPIRAIHVDTDPVARERAASRGIPTDQIFSTFEEASAHEPIDAVLVTVPLSEHAKICRQALEHGKHVLVEKPFTNTVREAEELVALANNEERILAVNQNYRYFPHAQAARKLVTEGYIGRPQALRVQFSRLYDENYRYFHLEQPLLSDMAIHHFDLMRYILDDEPIGLSCQAWGEPNMPFAGPPAAQAGIRFRSGIIVSYFGSWIARGVNSTYGGQWRLDAGEGQANWTFRGDQTTRNANDRFIVHRANANGTDYALPNVPLTDRAGVLSAFVRAVGGQGLDPVLSLAEDNVKSLKLMEAAIWSADRHGEWVEIRA